MMSILSGLGDPRPEDPLQQQVSNGRRGYLQHIDVLGPMRPSWWERWDEKMQFFNQGKRSSDVIEARPALERAFEDIVFLPAR